MHLTSPQIALQLDALHASEAFVFTRVAPGRYELVASAGVAPAPALVVLDDEPLAAAAVRDGVRRVASPDQRRVVAGYAARSAVLISPDAQTLVIIGRTSGCLAGVADAELVASAATLVARVS